MCQNFQKAFPNCLRVACSLRISPIRGWVTLCSPFSWNVLLNWDRGISFDTQNHRTVLSIISSLLKCHVFLKASQSVLKDTGHFAEANILCLQGTVRNHSQSMKFITPQQADNEIESIHLKLQTRCFHGILSVWFT